MCNHLPLDPIVPGFPEYRAHPLICQGSKTQELRADNSQSQEWYPDRVDIQGRRFLNQKLPLQSHLRGTIPSRVVVHPEKIQKYWLKYWHTLISKDTSSFMSNTLLIRFSKMLSVYIVYRMHKVMRRMVKWNAMSNTIDLSSIGHTGCTSAPQ